MIGLYTSQYGSVRNIPIARTGNVAAIPDEPVWTGRGFAAGYLVEARSIAGLSGSPAFLVIPPLRRYEAGLAYHPRADYHPIGIVLGMQEIGWKVDDISTPQWQHDEPQEDAIGPVVQRSTGLAAVAAMEGVYEIIESKEFDDLLRDAEMARGGAGRFVPTSAHPAGEASEPPSTELDPQHRERFNHLLGAAVRKPPQDD